MKIVLDTNVLVSGLLTPFGPCGEIVRMLASADVTLCYDARILSEYAEVLARPRFRFDPDRVAAILEQIEYRGTPVAAQPLSHSLPDADDEPFLAVALTGNVVCLVTGNRVHFPYPLCGKATVLSPAEFLAEWRKLRIEEEEREKDPVAGVEE
ncbi:MAG: putative toxin-antitoxin system toxin component, PIN family [Desulfuromonadales bacterium]